MSNYLDSSQLKNWRFSPETLHSLRRHRYEHAEWRIEKAKSSKPTVHKTSTETSSDDPTSHKRLRIGESTEVLSLDDELQLLKAYEQKIIRICATLQFSPILQATAVCLFKRFYLTRSPRQMIPDDIVYTCIFLAIKIESCPYTEVHKFTRQLADHGGINQSDLVANEMILLVAVNFDLGFWHPYRSLKGMIRYLQICAKQNPLNMAELPSEWNTDPWATLHRRAKIFVMHSLTTDCCFLFSPAQIALGCLSLAANSTPELPSPMNREVPRQIVDIVENAVKQLVELGDIPLASATLTGDVDGNADANKIISTIASHPASTATKNSSDLSDAVKKIQTIVRKAALTPDVSVDIKHKLSILEKSRDPAFVASTETYLQRMTEEEQIVDKYKQDKMKKQAEVENARKDQLTGTHDVPEKFRGVGRVLFG